MPRAATKTKPSPDGAFAARLNAAANETEQLLGRLLAAAPADGEIARPSRIVEAMRYTSLGGGKRLRPFLTVEAAALFGRVLKDLKEEGKPPRCSASNASRR